MSTSSRTYAEVDAFLNTVDDEHREKIPKKLRKLFIKNKEENYNVTYDLSKPIHEQEISKEAISIIALLHLNYWCKSEKEKQDLTKLFNENTLKKEEEKQKKYSVDNLFKNRKVEQAVTNEEEKSNMQMIEYKENVFNKIINFIKRMFKK